LSQETKPRTRTTSTSRAEALDLLLSVAIVTSYGKEKHAILKSAANASQK